MSAITYDDILSYVKKRGCTVPHHLSEYRMQGIPEEFDLVYIDGDHSYDGVRNDFNNYFEFIRSGGTIGFHDTRIFRGVKLFIKELKKDNRLRFVGEYYKRMGMAIFKEH